MPDLVFRSSGGEFLLALVLGVATVFLMYLAHRPLTRKNFLYAFVLKLIAVCLIAFLFLNPELRKEIPAKSAPALTILKDSSPSMQTVDEEGGGALISRREAVMQFLATPEWEDFKAKTKFQIREKNFGETEQETNLSLALSSAEESDAILLLSDGAWNAGTSPVLAAQEFRKNDARIFSLRVGQTDALPDLSIEGVDAPTLVETDEAFFIKSVVKSSFVDPMDVEVSLKDGEEILETQSVNIPAKGLGEISFQTEIAQEGARNYTVSVEHVLTEVSAENNTQELTVTAKAQNIKVLLVDTLPRWEYRFIRNAMMRDPQVDVSCLLLHPDLEPGTGQGYIESFPTESELAQYDVIFLGDIGIAEKQLQEKDVQAIISAVKQNSSGLMLLPGKQGWQQSLVNHPEFKELYPVRFNKKLGGQETSYQATLKLSNEGQKSLLLSLTSDADKNLKVWKSLPGFVWFQPVTTTKLGATTLAYHSSERGENGRIPIMVVSNSGRGKVLWMGMDSSWKWRRGVEDLYHYRYWRQIARWMSYQRNLTDGQQGKFFLSKETPTEGDAVLFHLFAITDEGAPAKAEETKFLHQLPDGSLKSIPLIATKNWGEQKGEITFEQAGNNELFILVNDKEVAKRTILVSEKEKEGVGETANAEILNEIARLTRAISLPYENRAEMISHLVDAASPPPRYDFTALNKQWGWYIIILLSIISSWIFRRVNSLSP